MNIYIKEFRHRVKNDGMVIIKGNKIIKKKPIKFLTVDLSYDKIAKVFLDVDRNIYKYKTIKELSEL